MTEDRPKSRETTRASNKTTLRSFNCLEPSQEKSGEEYRKTGLEVVDLAEITRDSSSDLSLPPQAVACLVLVFLFHPERIFLSKYRIMEK